MPRRKFPAAPTCDDLVRSRKPSPNLVFLPFFEQIERKNAPCVPEMCPDGVPKTS